MRILHPQPTAARKSLPKLFCEQLEDRTVPASFRGLGDSTNTDVFRSVAGVSGDGSVAVGDLFDPRGGSVAWSGAARWIDGQVNALATLMGGSTVIGISANGLVAVGSATYHMDPDRVGYDGPSQQAARWHGSNASLDLLGFLEDYQIYSTAYSASADGSVIVGISGSNRGIFNHSQAFRWTEAGGMQRLPSLVQERYTIPTKVSADGSVILGTSDNSGVFWSAGGPATRLSRLPGTAWASAADLSVDGSIKVGASGVTGNSESTSNYSAVRWTGNSIEDLDPAGLFVNSGATAVSGDGQVVVGNTNAGSSVPGDPFIWTQADGIQNLRTVLSQRYHLGSQLTGWVLTSATAISADGLTIVGNGYDPLGQPRAWIANLTQSDIAATSLKWNTTHGGVDFRYEVTGADLTQDTTAKFYWATGDRVADIIGGPVHSVNIAKSVGAHHADIPVDLLKANGGVPGNATHLIVRIDPDGQIGETNIANNDKPLGIPLTVITHGFQFSGILPLGPLPIFSHEAPQWTFEMAKAINQRVYFGLFSNAQIDNSVVAYGSNASVPPSGAAAFLVFNWAAVSSLDSFGTADDGNVGGTLASAVGYRLPLFGERDIHFIGHSRGTYVNADAIERLDDSVTMAKIGTLQMTTFDPQDFGDDGGGNVEGQLEVPTNVNYADNYFQTNSLPTNAPPIPRAGMEDGVFGGGRLVQNGFTRILNLDISYPLKQWNRYGIFDGGDHSETSEWYRYTIALGSAPGVNRDLLFNDSFRLDFDGNGTPDDPASGEKLGFAWAIELRGTLPAGRDLDGDGVPDDLEGPPTGSGDGNNDGIPDTHQANVRSIQSVVDPSKYVTLVSPSGTTLRDVMAVANPSGGSLPAGIQFPLGFFEFRLTGLTPGDSAQVLVLVPAGVPLNTYYKFGPLSGNSTPDWYEFDYDRATGTGARPVPSLRLWDLNLVDGLRGDDDRDADGDIEDPGGPGFNPPPTATLAGPNVGLPGQARTYTLSATDPVPDDVTAGFRYVVSWGDGTPDTVIVPTAGNGIGVPLDHAFATAGTFTIAVTAFDKDGGASSVATQTITISPVPVVTPPVTVPGSDPVPQIVPAGVAPPLYAVGAGAGGGPHVVVFDSRTGAVVRSFYAYAPAFTGGVRVAVGDVTGDGTPDIVTAAGAGGGPHVKVFDGVSGAEVRSFYAYDRTLAGGVSVAVGDLTGDGHAEIVTGVGVGGGPNVRVFDGRTGSLLKSFYAYDPSFTGGVSVAVGDVNGDGHADIVTAAGEGGGPHVKVFDGVSGAELLSFMAFDRTFLGGATVSVGDMDGDGRAEVVAGAGPGGGPQVNVFDGTSGGLRNSFMAYDPNFAGGVSVAARDADGDGRVEIATGPLRGGRSHLRLWGGRAMEPLDDQFLFDLAFLGGLWVS